MPNLSITDIRESQKSYPKEYRGDFPLADNYNGFFNEHVNIPTLSQARWNGELSI